MIRKLATLPLVTIGALLPAVAFAQDAYVVEAVVEEVATLDSGDTAWMLTATALVLFMTIPGIALFYSGMVRKKNVLATLMQSFAICALCSVLWIALGYSLAFGSEGPIIGDLSKVFMKGVTIYSLSGTFPETVWVVFQLTFAVLTPALITGAFAERMKFSSMMIFMAVWSLLVYAPVCHWVWGGGFLGEILGNEILDFAGGTVVHINSGIAGLVCALMLGRRIGLGSTDMAPFNLTLAVLGACILWVGWFGFNAGSAGAADAQAGMAMLVTQFATAAAALTWMFCEWISRGKPSVLGIISGAVAGLVAITPAAGAVDPMGAFFIGIAAGIICFFASTWLKHKLGYDDSLDVFGIHGVGGLVGAILTGVFAVEAVAGEGVHGLIEGNASQVLTQILGCVATIVWCALVSAVVLFILDKTIGIRVKPEEEIEGLDLSLHGERIQ